MGFLCIFGFQILRRPYLRLIWWLQNLFQILGRRAGINDDSMIPGARSPRMVDGEQQQWHLESWHDLIGSARNHPVWVCPPVIKHGLLEHGP